MLHIKKVKKVPFGSIEQTKDGVLKVGLEVFGWFHVIITEGFSDIVQCLYSMWCVSRSATEEIGRGKSKQKEKGNDKRIL